jgi:hypothetical protein
MQRFPLLLPIELGGTMRYKVPERTSAKVAPGLQVCDTNERSCAVVALYEQLILCVTFFMTREQKQQ